MTIKELGLIIKNLPEEMMVNVSVKKTKGTSSDPIIYVADEDKIYVGIVEGAFWIDGEFAHDNAVNAEGSHV